MAILYYESELSHHGVKGMKWGQHIFGDVKAAVKTYKRRRHLAKARKIGAEKRKQAKEEAEKQQKEAEAREAKKEAVLKSRSASSLYMNADLFSNEELQRAYNRLELESKIYNLKSVSKGKKTLDEVTDWGKKITDLGTTGIKGWNIAAGVYNASLGPNAKEDEKLPIVKTG